MSFKQTAVGIGILPKRLAQQDRYDACYPQHSWYRCNRNIQSKRSPARRATGKSRKSVTSLTLFPGRKVCQSEREPELLWWWIFRWRAGFPSFPMDDVHERLRNPAGCYLLGLGGMYNGLNRL